MSLLLVIAAALAALVATILGFGWLGTTAEQWPGWAALSLLLYFLSLLAGGIAWPAPLRRGPR